MLDLFSRGSVIILDWCSQLFAGLPSDTNQLFDFVITSSHYVLVRLCKYSQAVFQSTAVH